MTDGLSGAFMIPRGYTLVPPPWADRLRIVTVKIPQKIIEILDEIAYEQRKHRSEVIREAIENYIELYYALQKDEVIQ